MHELHILFVFRFGEGSVPHYMPRLLLFKNSSKTKANLNEQICYTTVLDKHIFIRVKMFQEKKINQHIYDI